MTAPIELRGMTWDHPRGIDPLVAHAKAYEASHGVKITWDARLLEDFEAFPLDELVEKYDLLVIDHPHVGTAAASGCLLPLDVPPAGESVGRSHESYFYDGRQWALAIDAAAQVSLRRVGRLKQWPQSWDEVLELSINHQVVWPLKTVHALMSFYTLCAGYAGKPCATSGPELVDRETANIVFDLMQRVVQCLPKYCLDFNPIDAFRWLRQETWGIYVPLIYGYVTYSRDPREFEFGDIIGVKGSTLGGTGIAVSARSKHRQAAVAVAIDLASAPTQRGVYAQFGGQPAHRSAWTDDSMNPGTNGFYRNTLATLDASYLRPRFDGYVAFQHTAGVLVGACSERLVSIASTVDRLNDGFARVQGLVK